MKEIRQNYSLKLYNTFGLEAKTKYYIEPLNIDELVSALSSTIAKTQKTLVLGGGSNILFVNNFEGLVIHPNLLGKSIVEQNNDYATVKAFAGEDWDKFVQWTVDNRLSGLENLSLIPGSVGACPVQNIGAYGVEVSDSITKLEAVEIATGQIKIFENEECEFAYRNSVFKKKLKNQYIIFAVYFKLSKKPVLKTHYGTVEQELKNFNKINLRSIRQAIINIRESKLPNPNETPNAGSFFKNPVISTLQAQKLKERFPEIISYPVGESSAKLAAGWLIDYLGWKGKKNGGAGVHQKQALVLVNCNNATGKEIIELAEKIKIDVYQTFDVQLEFEVNII